MKMYIIIFRNGDIIATSKELTAKQCKNDRNVAGILQVESGERLKIINYIEQYNLI